jgi:hypothetical protein
MAISDVLWDAVDHKELGIVELSDGFAVRVRDMSVPHTEYHQWGYLCRGCPTRDDAEQFIAEYIVEQIAERMKNAKPLPF